MEQVFCQNFTASQQGIGEVLSVPLCSNGEEKMVTEENRREYVELYISHVLNTSVHRQVCILCHYQLFGDHISVQQAWHDIFLAAQSTFII